MCEPWGLSGQCRRKCSKCWSRDSPAAQGCPGVAETHPQPVEIHMAAKTNLQALEEPTPQQVDAQRSL